MTTNLNYKRFYQIIDLLRTYGEMELGCSDINVDAVVNLLQSNSLVARCWNCPDEKIEEIFIEDILNGLPVWRVFNLPEWTLNMLEREYAVFVAIETEKQKKIDEENKKKYKCLQGCVHYDYKETSFGTFVKCKATGACGDCFKMKEKCKLFSTEENNTHFVGRRPRNLTLR